MSAKNSTKIYSSIHLCWRFNQRLYLCFLFLLTQSLAAPALAQIELASHIQDQMVVQRGAPWKISGTSSDNISFDVEFGGQLIKVRPSEGQWKAQFNVPSDLSGPVHLIIDGGRLVRKVQVGDVWLCSGQSNMALGLGGVADKNEIIQSLNGKAIYIFQVAKPIRIPQPNAGRWMKALSWGGFSAVCLAFGASLYDRINVPIGLIDATLGATWIESWISASSISIASSAQAAIARFENAAKQRKIKDLRADTYGIDKPSQLFDLMIAPLGKQAIKGVLWYQGEGDGRNGTNYAELLSLLIKDWRTRWNNPQLPFIVMQLPGFGVPTAGLDLGSDLALVRDAQRIAVASSAPAGLVVSVDLGDGTMHPKKKLPFGQRASNIAFELVYNKGSESFIPMPTTMDITGDTVQIKFEGGKACLQSTPALPDTIFISGEDHRWYSAEVSIRDSSIYVRSSQVSHPVEVRYAWSNYPLLGLLTCEGGIPVTPFGLIISNDNRNQSVGMTW
ncbi:sialate O-acetylesterase [Nitrosospira multiformis]|uniref:sialate O-acetylesterase n=1 Tax=Nitrosospira multiformis TaxID=1231 RepID=UPI001587F43D|nr:sialate O-acetylesterase [Nitrosospira multiformis]